MALSNAEKQAAWRRRRDAQIASLQAEVEQLRAENAGLRAELAALRSPDPVPLSQPAPRRRTAR